MANILRAQENPPFRWYYAWTRLDEAGDPVTDYESALKQPETVRVRWDKEAADGKTREVSADVVPDKGSFGAEFALIYTIPEFESKIRLRLDKAAKDYVPKIHDLFGRCLQGKASTKWNKVLKRYPVVDRTEDTFKSAQQDYLESVAEIKNLGDMVIRQLRDLHKPMFLPVEGYIDRRDEWQRHIDSGYLRVTLSQATAQERAEQVFVHQPKKHQAKYGAEHEDVEVDIETLKTYFKGCHAKDVSDGTYEAIVKSIKHKRGGRKNKDEDGWTKVESKKSSSTYRKGGGEQEPRRSSRQTERYGGRRYGNSGRDYQRSRGRNYKESRHGNAGRATYYQKNNDDRGRDRHRDDRRGGENYHGRRRGDNGQHEKPKGNHGQHVHHVEEEQRSLSRSPSKERSPSRSQDSRSRRSNSHCSSISSHRSIHAYAAVAVDGAVAIDDASMSSRDKTPDKIIIDPSRPRWQEEMSRGKQTTKKGRRKGFGSWYMREPGQYSKSERLAEQGNPDRIRTADLQDENKLERELADDDSLKESDWLDRTGVDPVQYKMRMEAEQRLKANREKNKASKKRKIE
mmetsp:Transcript_5824/g.9968  ORF Transcript_5824/g.9968 Transcript_5824/m.9968 type:complete len:570 (+) Transcript_5824:162-1871(+)